ncbi:WD-40 repeat-containing protein [[Leptolyngbya] sp. PCC 7376]|uniref:WD40 repeat domain-containing protein n=1 Tax=[Leptolyngbya] sp. PCC 7376 TaxID=111781 RepID=UPI00029F2452|nr:WD40 repeat domain-containing protein [[Leptolyngbya] sp. PCC 7376]AFY37013.1 WD-40 repeat-containing protein [[Leptolyngbya] sp. PCC 7376]
MVRADHFDLINAQNRRSQSVLERSLFFAPQEFSLLLVRCNYHALTAEVQKKLCASHQLNKLWQQQEQEFQFEYFGNIEFEQLVSGKKHRGVIYLRLTAASTNLESILSSVFEHLEKLGVQRDCAAGVMVSGLEQVGRLALSLALLNQVRDQLSYLLPCPLVLWLTERGARKLFRLAPDVKSWAVTSIQFNWDVEHLQKLLHQFEADCFRQLEQAGGLQFVSNKDLDLAADGRRRLELELARAELQQQEVAIAQCSEGFWAFIQGRDAYGSHDLTAAHQHYLDCLKIYGSLAPDTEITPEFLQGDFLTKAEGLSGDRLPKLAMLCFHLSLLYDEWAQEQYDGVQNWQQGEAYLRAGLALWKRLKNWPWVAHLTTALGLMLRQLESWQALEDLGWSTTKNLDMYCSQMLLTRNYGVLAEVAIANQQWEKAQMLAQSAIETYERCDEDTSEYDLPWYYLVIAQAQQHLVGSQAAIVYLESAHDLILRHLGQAQRQTWSGWYLRLYRDILQLLRHLHREMGHYEQAFDLQRELQQCEQQWGWQVFFGAAALPTPLATTTSELRQNTKNILLASRRQDDVKRLLERLSRDEHKLTILHGFSGVGKTSLLQAGLVPNLRGQLINARETLPIMLKKYGQWHRQLAKAIATERLQFIHHPSPGTDSEPITLLQENGNNNLLTVLIFDQFEQFLEQYPTPTERRDFFRFLTQCLQLPFIKIILSLREDHLAYLLEWETAGHLGIVNDNLLDRNIRYRLGNLEAEAAHNLLTFLSERAPRPLEAAFVDRLIGDLSDDLGTVRPIELQVIGFQLQQDNITTLGRYLELGRDPKQTVLEKFLSQIVDQCGSEHHHLAWQFLYHLTSPRQTRPEVTYDEFIRLCRSQKGSIPSCRAIADLILHIFVGTGLVIRHRYGVQDTYQLVHDYLVQPIRNRQSNVQSQELAERLASQDREISRIRRHWGQSIATIGALLAVVASMVFLAQRANRQRYRQWQVTQNAELMALSNASEALFYSDQQFEALLESLRATVRLRALLNSNPEAIAPATKLKVLSTLEQSYFGLQENNRFEGHSDSVFDINLSPDGQYLASAGLDNTVRLWNMEGELLQTMIGHEERVTRVVFAPDSQSIFSSSWDNTVKEWSISGKELRTLDVDLETLTAINLSNDGQRLAIAGGSGAALYNVDGSLIKRLVSDRVIYWINFSPDNTEILTLDDNNQITLWDQDGNVRQTLRIESIDATQLLFATFSPDGNTLIGSDTNGNLNFWQRGDRQELFTAESLNLLAAHTEPIFFVSFNQDGSQFATASADNLVKIWDKNFNLLNTFSGHRDDIRTAIFHPDTKQVISASMDKSMRLWEAVPDRRITLRHELPIRDLRFAKDGNHIATASLDTTIKLWERQSGKLLHTLQGHTDWINAVAWHPNGEKIISGSDDQTVRLWSRNGQPLETLTAHKNRVLDVEYSPDGSLFASSDLDGVINIWSADGTLLQTLAEHEDRVNSINFSPDSKLLASASDDRTVKVWQRRADNSFFLVSQFEPHSSWVTDVTFSGGGEYLAFSGYDNIIQVQQMRYQNNNPQFDEPITLKGHSDSIANLRFSPIVPLLATSTWNNQLQLWTLDDTLLKSLDGHTDLITGLDWSPDGGAIATASNDNTAIIWELDLDRLLAKSCDWLQFYLRHNPKVRDGDRQLCDPLEPFNSASSNRSENSQ